MSKKHAISAILILVFIATGMFFPRGFDSSAKAVFQIEKGQTLREISINLKKQQLIWWDSLFKIYSLLQGKTGSLQAGCYLLSPKMNIPEIARILSSGEIAKEKITIPEGFTSEQIYERLARTVLANDPLTKTVPDAFEDREGYLFPDTYEIPYCMEHEKIIGMMTDNFARKTIGLKITPEVAAMASLLEKELQTLEDKKIASGILWKRLRAGMPLQIDAHMWTYEHYGLPVKPIANPGLESIEAALNPKNSAYWYYLSAPDGKTIFSATLEGHNIAKAKYLK